MIGERLGPYRIDRELGSGGMGKVYAAVAVDRAAGLAEGTRVALKVLHPHLLETPGSFKRFLREAEIGRSVVHENVVRTLDCDAVRADGQDHHFLVMEYVEGQTLRDLLHELDRVPEELCRHVGREVSKGLAAIHAAGVVHRDVKPENVLITKEHLVKVMDLGVARLDDGALRLSQTGAFVGSLHYAAPECLKGDAGRVDGRADLHALGLVLYELSCGTNPYVAGDVSKTLERILHEEPRRLGDVNPQLSPFFEEVVHCLLAKEPDERFADARTLLGVLQEGEASAWWKTRARKVRAVTHQPMRRIRIPRETAVYGREGEIAKLRALYQKAKAGEGQVVLIEGEAGIGKSRVIDELVGRLQRDGERLHFLFGSYPPGGAATASGAFSTAFREQLGDTDLADAVRVRLGPAGALAPSFAALLLGTSAPAGAAPLTKESLQTCFVMATRSLAAERPTVLLIEDLHFATDDARSLFTSLAMATPGQRILLVGSTRHGNDERWVSGLTRLPQVSPLALARLGPEDLTLLLRDSLGSEPLARSLALQVGLKSDGNPFFAFEIIRGLREGRYLTQQGDGTWVRSRVVEDIPIPSSVLDLVNARVAELDEADRNLLDVACCWGFEFDPGLIGDVLGVPRIPLLKRFGQIERRHRLVRASGRNMVFDHHQVQEALYERLLVQLREEYHAALASALEARARAAEGDPATLAGTLCVDLCEHFLKGAQSGRALRYLEPSLAYLEKGYHNDAAIRLAERALAVPGLLAGIERARTLVRLCGPSGPLDRQGRRERQEQAAREAERLAVEAADDELRGRAARALAHVYEKTSRNAEAEEVFGRVIEIARACGHRQGEAGAEGGLGNVTMSQGRLGEARGHHERALAICRAIGDREGEALSLGNLGTVLISQGRLVEAREHCERALAIHREIGNRPGEALTTAYLGGVFGSQGRLAEAREHYERALAIDREIGDREGEAVDLVNLGPLRLALGDRGGARLALESSLGISRDISSRFPEGFALQGLGALADEEGDLRAALRFTEEALTLRRKIGHGEGVAESLLELAALRRRSADPAGARAALEEGVTLARAEGRAPLVALALAMLADLSGGDGAAVAAALAARTEAGEHEHSQRTCWLLWQATGDLALLAEANRLLEETLAKSPRDREPMLANVRRNREIHAEARKAGLRAAPPGTPSGSIRGGDS